MHRINLVLLVLAVSAFTACATNSSAPAAATASPSASPAADVQEASLVELGKTIIELEKKTWETTNSSQAEAGKKYYLPDYRAIYFGGIKSLEENIQDSKDMTLKSFAMSEEKVTFPVKDTALLTYRYTADSTYKGKKTGGPTLASSVWVRVGGEWKNALYTETSAAPAK